MRLLFLLFTIFSGDILQAQCRVPLNKTQLDGSQPSTSQAIFDPQRARQVDSIVRYLNTKYQTTILYNYITTEYNAYFDPQTKQLYFGTALFNDVYRTGGIAAIAFIICHEYAHSCQDMYSNGNRLVNGTSRVHELQADFLAAYFEAEMIQKKVVNYNEELDMMKLMDAIFQLGDNKFTNKDHHGTWAERTLTTFFPTVTQLGTRSPRDLKTILEFANQYYTNKGIIGCASNIQIQGGPMITGVGILFNDYSQEECIIGIDFKLYVFRHKGYWGNEFNTSCSPIGEIDYSGEQLLSVDDEAVGFYIKMYDNIPYYPKRFFVYNRSVYTDHSMTQFAPNLYWRSKTLDSK